MEVRQTGFAKLIFKKETTKGIKHLLECERINVTCVADQSGAKMKTNSNINRKNSISSQRTRKTRTKQN